VPFDHLNRRFIDMIKFAFSVGYEVDNDFKVKFDYLNHHFLTSSKSQFGIGQEAAKFFAVPCNH